jgi:hypothetical protein
MKGNTIEIRDPDIEEADIRRRIQTQVAQRRADGAYPVDVLQAGPSSFQPSRLDVAVSPTTFPGLNEALLQLLDLGVLVEPDFTSSAPVVGPLIVAFRRAWNWMSTKWYVRPIMQQQSAVNTQLVELVAEMAQWQELQAQELAVLEARLASLESRLEEAA